MKILINAVLDLNKDGAGVTHFTEVANNLQKEKHKVLALCPGFYPNRKKYWGFKIVYVPTFKKNLFSMLFYEFLNIFFLAFWVIRFKPDIIHCRYNVATLYLPLIAKFLKVNYFVEVNGILENELRLRRFSEFVIRCVKFTEIINFKFAKKIICVTNGIKKEIQKKYKIPRVKLEVVGNGANPDVFYPRNKYQCRNKLALLQNKFIVGFIGSLAPWRGLINLAKAVLVIKNSNPELYKNLLIIIVGEGEEKKMLVELVNEYNLNCFNFLSSTEYKNIPYFINAFDVCTVFFSRNNLKVIGSPIKLFEYLACGKPIIATDIDGINNLYKCREYIIFLPSMNPIKIAEKINYCYQHKKIIAETGKRGRKIFLERYTWSNVAKILLAIFKTS